ncbi:MAG: hypothetical protein M0Q99_08690 [Candidatus Cloacimonetes bacterium]|nr:hypothetical protein [Candidatus Cloacimonadota bacterium]MCK9335375.1 hypothetical protein [Candidatus Cloacimonadota bacterium]
MGNVLFFAIGHRDLQAIYDLPNGNKRRSGGKIKDILDQKDSLPLTNGIGIRELRRDEKKPETPNGLCFPIFDKIMAYIASRKIKTLDYLFILSTDRSQVLPVLRSIKAKWEEDLENLPELYDYLDQGMIRWIEDDHSTPTAKFLKECITEGRIYQDAVQIRNIVILKLGSYKVLQPIMKINITKPIKQEILELADINTLDFFEQEAYYALSPYFAELEDAQILLGTHAGGMPLLHRALDNVLQNCVGHAEYKRIFTSEYLSYMEDKKTEHKFLDYIGQMNHSVINMQWDRAQLCLDMIRRHYPELPALVNYKGLERAIKEGKELWETKGSWFERFTAHIFRAIYTDSFNELVVWITSMEQAAKLDLAARQIGILWKSVDIEKSKVELLEPIGHERSLDLDVFKLIGRIPKEKILKAFEDYIAVFGDHTEGWDDPDWHAIRKMRNKLMHNGIAPAVNQQNRARVYGFLNLSPEAVRQVKLAIGNRDLASIIKFEKACLANVFFAPLGRIVNFSKDMLKERQCSINCFRALHSGQAEV